MYEDDEPVEDVVSAFDAGEKGVTAPGVNARLDLPGIAVTTETNRTAGDVRRP